ncbi:MAG: aminotransferase class V-fold PLP-dependent enzyme [Salibacteraceae bacterium]
MKDNFLLNPKINFLNHGSFGACPKPIFQDYQNWQLKLEQDPVNFIVNEGPKALNTSRKALAEYINCNDQDLVYMPNPTTALNTVIKSLDLNEGDEVLTTNQEYGALDRTWDFYCKKSGAKYVQANISLPLVSKEKFLEEFWAALTPRTKIIFLSHITSTTALIFPAQEICDKANELGIICIIDGAHVPGHIPLNIKKLNPHIYTGANHKWLLTPKGNTFLYVKEELQHLIDPLIVSWGYDSVSPSESQFQDYHQYNGTKDFSAYLTTPAALQFFKENNWESEKSNCRKLLKHYYPIVAKELNSAPLCPLTDEFLGQICSIPIQTNDPLKLKSLLLDKYKIEVPIMQVGKKVYLRISFQAYNSELEIEQLIEAIRSIKSETALL